MVRQRSFRSFKRFRTYSGIETFDEFNRWIQDETLEVPQDGQTLRKRPPLPKRKSSLAILVTLKSSSKALAFVRERRAKLEDKLEMPKQILKHRANKRLFREALAQSKDLEQKANSRVLRNSRTKIETRVEEDEGGISDLNFPTTMPSKPAQLKDRTKRKEKLPPLNLPNNHPLSIRNALGVKFQKQKTINRLLFLIVSILFLIVSTLSSPQTLH
jgi:hypothetical protein